MLIYQGTTTQFKDDVLKNRIADMMSERFESVFGRKVGDPEYNSWSNSCQHLKNLIDISKLSDNMICLEYEVPYSNGRIDCLLFGRGESGKAYVVMIELKQWSDVEVVDDEDNFIETYVAGDNRKVPHPAQQVEGYHNHLISFVKIFEIDPDYNLYSCAYCHNYTKENEKGLFHPRFNTLVDRFPVYTKEDVRKLADRLTILLSKGDGFEIFNRFMQSPVSPSKKLLDEVSKIIDKNEAVFSLLNEQLVAKNVIMSKVKLAVKNGTKSVIVVHGGPGTGKTVIALNLLADLARQHKSVFYACKSKPFREALSNKIGKTSRILISNLDNFNPVRVEENNLDVILVDEAHRMAKTSNSQYTKKEYRTDIPPVEQLIRCAKTAVFFIDDKQLVRSQEIGSSSLIQQYAQKYKAQYDSVELISQFRCAGSDNFLDWLEYVLGYSQKPVNLSKDDRYEFRIFDNPNELYKVLKSYEAKKPNSARLVAGYCWPWSKELAPDGTLKKDVVIKEHGFAMPWESQDSYPSELKDRIPKWYQWAFKPGGIGQVGCIYTVQGFEFDYIGVIVGPDLKYDSAREKLYADIKGAADPTLQKSPKDFEKYVMNIYRVLMTRGMKGCYVYFVNKDVEKYFKKHIEGDPSYVAPLTVSDVVDDHMPDFIEQEIEAQLRYKEYLPLYSLEAACGAFGEGQDVEVSGWIKVQGLGKLSKNMFVVKTAGKSMEPLIKDGNYCVFRTPVVGSRNEKIVLVQHNGIADPETGGKYNIKKYTSKKKYSIDETWEHEEITLLPINAAYSPIVIPNTNEGEFMVIAEFIAVLK